MEGQLLITLKDGALAVQGPIDNPLLCYALLEGARDIIHMKATEAQRSRTGIVVPTVPLPAPGSPFGPRK